MPASLVYAFGAPENDGERRVIGFLKERLPDGYRVYHTMERYSAGQTYEWDVLMLAPHALFCLEVKDWPGRIVGNDRDWVLASGAVRRNPVPLITKKARILKSQLVAKSPFLGGAGGLWVEGLVVIADEKAELALTGDCVRQTVTLQTLLARLTDAVNPLWAGKDHRAAFREIHNTLTEDFRPAASTKEIAHFRLVEQIGAGDPYTEWRAENRFASAHTPVRLKIYAPDPYRPVAEREQQLLLVRRDFEAAARMGSHPNILGVRDFFPVDDGRYLLVLEDLPGTPLSAELLPGRDLTFERKLRIVEDIAVGLVHVHACKVVHRDLRPGNIWLTPGGAVLVNFDCARVGNGKTVQELVQDRLDPHYLAPEVKASVASAGPASDVYALGAVLYELLTGHPPADGASIPSPSAYDPLVEPELDELALSMLAGEPAERPAANEVRDRLIELRDQRRAGTQEHATGTTAASGSAVDYAVGSKIDGQYLVREVLGEGSFGKVYRVYQPVTNLEYAMKIFHDPGLGLEDAQKEFAALLPLSHDRIARVWHAGLLRHGPEGGQAYYLLTQYIPGRPLQQLLDEDRPAPSEALRITADVLRALEYLHSKQYIHRDIKPSNLLVSPEGAWLIDFGIAARAATTAHDTAGTPLYTPPDVAACAVQPSRDLFAAGVVLYQMLTGQHPYGGPPLPGKAPHDPLDDHPRLSDTMACVLRRAVAPHAAARYTSTAEFLADLRAIDEPLRPATPTRALARGIRIPSQEQALPNYNPYLTRFLTLYSQNRTDNSGTRGYDEVSRATYVRTLLDKRLAPDIVAGTFRLVIISGNAGDGKTAFLQSLEEALAEGRLDGVPKVPVTRLPSGNGAAFTLAGRRYRTNYDGSQDEVGLQNDDVLADFLAPFSGTAEQIAARHAGVAPEAGEARLVAINEGKLRDFLGRRRGKYPWLAQAIENYLDKGQPLPEGYLVVNLNDRSVVAPAAGSRSIVDQQIQALSDPVFWEPCLPCRYQDRCPVKFNVDTVNHPDLGPRVRERIGRLFEVAHLRNRLHLTMRAVRSALAFWLFGQDDCRAIGAQLEGAQAAADADEALLRRFYHSAIALDSPSTAHGGGDGASETDRLLQLVSEADVGIGANPRDDADLHFNGVNSALLPTAGSRSDYDRELLRAWAERLGPDNPADGTDAHSRLRLHAMVRRKAFFERPDDGWRAMLPYTVLDRMLRAVAGDAAALDALKSTLLQGINRWEGIGDIQDALLLRVARGVPGMVRSYRQFPAADFTLRPARPVVPGGYLETSPVSLELVYGPGANGAQRERPTLRLSLDLVELLVRMAQGYAPTTAEARGALVNLLVFRTLLAHEEYDSLVLVDAAQEERYLIEQRHGQIALKRLAAPGAAAVPAAAPTGSVVAAAGAMRTVGAMAQ